MFNLTTIVRGSVLLIFLSISLLGQQKPAPAPAGVREFPVVLQQNVESGKTAVGTKVEAKLAIATLVNRVVIPKDAIFLGTVIESVAKGAKSPSRLAIRMDSVQWKDGSRAIRAYLIPWYYPKETEAGPNLQYKPPEPPAATWNGAGQYPNRDSRVYQPFPGADSDKPAGAIPDTASSVTSNNAVRMKDVALAPTADGGIVLVSQRANFKLDKLTTYVLAAAAE